VASPSPGSGEWKYLLPRRNGGLNTYGLCCAVSFTLRGPGNDPCSGAVRTRLYKPGDRTLARSEWVSTNKWLVNRGIACDSFISSFRSETVPKHRRKCESVLPSHKRGEFNTSRQKTISFQERGQLLGNCFLVERVYARKKPTGI